MIMGASLARAASRQALMPELETQLTAGMAYPVLYIGLDSNRSGVDRI